MEFWRQKLKKAFDKTLHGKRFPDVNECDWIDFDNHGMTPCAPLLLMIGYCFYG